MDTYIYRHTLSDRCAFTYQYARTVAHADNYPIIDNRLCGTCEIDSGRRRNRDGNTLDSNPNRRYPGNIGCDGRGNAAGGCYGNSNMVDSNTDNKQYTQCNTHGNPYAHIHTDHHTYCHTHNHAVIHAYCHPYANGYADAVSDSYSITYTKFHADQDTHQHTDA